MGGFWTSANTAIATVDAGTGTFAGIAAGPAIISYTFPTGCTSSIPVLIYTSPAPVLGSMTVCQASSITLTDATTTGTWSTSDGTIATVILGTLGVLHTWVE